ncbi:hypothetical protein ONS95_002992 [Cadophora gregata]|uniref:uncharacterized protein n=1 Tax=Cadophora gregata TaxID=51156 RepID=UPI0026DD8148|nr:uncharacterized protein ONS95_002992 [Cadophora gregata]KAK0108170.1 hypothetical protein ONS95_002992 [Cadophora gregata]
MAIEKLPVEVLQDIVSYLSSQYTNRKDLLSCSQTCRSFWDAATSTVYRDINLQCYHNMERLSKKIKRRQLCLMKTIAENPNLGLQVRTFLNDSGYISPGMDVTRRGEINKLLLIEAANNLRSLSKASFNLNPLAVQVVTTLPSYRELSEVTLNGFTPSKHIWKNSKTSLRKLHWKKAAPQYTYRRGGLQDLLIELRLLFKVVETTCPEMEVLDFQLAQNHHYEPETDTAIPTDLVSEYSTLPNSTDAKLPKLRHFGLNLKGISTYRATDDIKTFILDIVGRYGHSLNSITIPGGDYGWSREGLDFVLKVCSLVPDLRELNLLGTDLGSDSKTKLRKFEALWELTTSPATAKIEKFSTMNIHNHFSREAGQLFQNWKSLKFLQLGDKDNTGGPFGDDGRPDFEAYRPHILEFIKALPPSLQELFLEINGHRIWCDENEDFDPMCLLSPEIFHALPRLHTCDLHAWISNRGGGIGPTPEKGVFYRRLPGDAMRPKQRTIWTSRMDSIYQDEDILVKKWCYLVEDEAFEGEDAKEIWLDGATFADPRMGTSRGSPPGGTDWSWPFCADLIPRKIGNYEMFRSKY